MKKSIEIKGKKYSSKKFEGYTHRAKVKFIAQGKEYFRDFYTTDDSKDNFLGVLKSFATQKVDTIEIYHWTTKEQDDAVGEWIDESLKNWK